MPKFTYIARDPKGSRIEGALEVEDRQAVVARLQAMGFFPVKITDITPKTSAFSLSFLRGKVRAVDISRFMRQISDLVGSGVPLVRALEIILNQTRAPLLRDIITEVSKNVQGGDTLAQALQRHPKVFPPLTIAMVKAGETGGMLDDVLKRLADFSEQEEELKGKVISALAYPAIMVVAGIIVISVLITVVIPRITGVFAELQQDLPPITLFLMGITGFISRFKWILLGGAIVIGIAIHRFIKSAEGRALFDSLVLRVPVLGDVIHKRQLSHFSRTLGNLLHNGVPILNALDITRDVLTNTIIRKEIDKLPASISQGASMASTLGENEMFPVYMVSMIAIGEETAQVDSVLLKIADAYETQVDRSLKTLTSVLEPIIILLLGCVVGFIVIAMMLPIMSLDPTQAGE